MNDVVLTKVTAYLPDGRTVSSSHLKALDGAVMWDVLVEGEELDVPGVVRAWRSGEGRGRTRRAAIRAAVRQMQAGPLSSVVRS